METASTPADPPAQGRALELVTSLIAIGAACVVFPGASTMARVGGIAVGLVWGIIEFPRRFVIGWNAPTIAILLAGAVAYGATVVGAVASFDGGYIAAGTASIVFLVGRRLTTAHSPEGRG